MTLIPDTVRIGPMTYNVYLATNEKHNAKNGEPLHWDKRDEWVLGEITYGKAAIYLEDAQHPAVKQTTLMHEIVHGILLQSGQYKANNDEGLINAIAFGMVDLLKQNPALIAYLTSTPDDPSETVSA